MALAMSLGLIAWEPKVPSISGLWMLKNLLMVSFAEEAFFRGYLQGRLSRIAYSPETGHRFHGKAITDSMANWSLRA